MDFEVQLSNGEIISEQEIGEIVEEIIGILKSRQMTLPAIEFVLGRTLKTASAKAILK